MLIFYFFKDDIVDIGKFDVISPLTFLVDEFSGFYLHLSMFSIKYSRSTYKTNGALSDF